MSQRGCEHFTEDMHCLIDRMRLEYSMTYAEIVGCMELVKGDIVDEAREESEDA